MLASVIAVVLWNCNSASPTVSVAPQDTGPAHSFVVVSTGQNKYYNDIGREIPLPRKGEPFYGQDAQYVSIPMQYKDNGDGTVTDLNTGLMWQKTDDGQQRNWADAKQYCGDLVLGGYDDWRLPRIDELETIVDYSRVDPAIDPLFTCESNAYWTSSHFAGNPAYVWYVICGNGYANWNSMSTVNAVRCVRGVPW